jgi:hypothetical protein
MVISWPKSGRIIGSVKSVFELLRQLLGSVYFLRSGNADQVVSFTSCHELIDVMLPEAPRAAIGAPCK